MSLKTFNEICALLGKHNINYKVLTHESVITSEDAAKVRGRSFEENLRRAAKALIIRSEGKFYQFVVPGNQKLDFKKAKKLLNTKSLSLATHDEVLELTDCSVGSVPPLGILWNIPVYADNNLAEEIDFSAGMHEKSITIALDDWKKIVNPIMVYIVN